MKIAIIGTGNVGSALAQGWTAHGHEITFGSREPERDDVQALVAKVGSRARATTITAAAAAAPVVVLAVPWRAVETTVAEIDDWTDKILLDTTNPIASGLQPLFGSDTSGAEEIARQADNARVVKAFNTTGAENMANPDYDGQALTMFICGDNGQAKSTVTNLARDLGFEAADVGDLSAARLLESMALVWIRLASRQGLGRQIGFKLLRRQ
ncbi:MAG: NADPH-dependent F420 reductase [Candidatus Promineifilaceae bacterium]|nr:NADPH-dependent F420 reductase [Candidatus Promineifilaceae bacterium]